MSDQVFVDTSWFKALSDPKDDFSLLARKQFLRFKTTNTALITTNFILDETFTLIRAKVNLRSAMDFRRTLVSMRDVLRIVRILEKDESGAWEWFPNNWSRLSFTDCTSFAVMKRLGLNVAATFDEHFVQAGFKAFS